MLIALPCSLNEIVRPMLDRKILGGAHYQKNKTGWPLNDTFKRGLRNALTGLYVVSPRCVCHFHLADLRRVYVCDLHSS
jgi:hypothetical protein